MIGSATPVCSAILVRPFLAVVPDPIIEVGLQAVDRRAELLAEGDAIELVKHGFVETLDDAVIRDTGRREHECAGRPAPRLWFVRDYGKARSRLQKRYAAAQIPVSSNLCEDQT